MTSAFFGKRALGVSCALFCATACHSTRPAIIVYQSDFGDEDGAVSAMRGVARQVDPTLLLEDLTHQIEQFNVWEAAYRLRQTVPYWPRDTVFVSVVDPGVGTPRRSVVARSATGQTFVTPDNGTLTLVKDCFGIVAAREIDPRHRLPGSEASATFHGRDVFSYAAALLASGQITFEEVGPPIAPDDLVTLSYERARLEQTPLGSELSGTIPVLDRHYGNVWTNIPFELLAQAAVAIGSSLDVTIGHGSTVRFAGRLPFVTSFGNVPAGQPLAYVNSLGNLAFAINKGSFAQAHEIQAGNDWLVRAKPAR